MLLRSMRHQFDLRTLRWGLFQRQIFRAGVPVKRTHTTNSGQVARIASPSIWSSMVPKFLRRGSTKPSKSKPKGWNPATFFIVIFLLIGSQSIRIIAEQKDLLEYTRKADAKLELLRKVLDSLKRGEDVDVEKMLGTGDEQKEREWEEGKHSFSYSGQMLMSRSHQGDRVF